MKSRRRKKLETKNSRGDRIFGITLFLVIVIIAVGSVWYGLMPADQQLQTTSAYGLPVGYPTLTTCVSSGNVLLKLNRGNVLMYFKIDSANLVTHHHSQKY